MKLRHALGDSLGHNSMSMSPTLVFSNTLPLVAGSSAYTPSDIFYEHSRFDYLISIFPFLLFFFSPFLYKHPIFLIGHVLHQSGL
jgi:hypothetical protein